MSACREKCLRGARAENERHRQKERDRGIIRKACRLISPASEEGDPPPHAKNGHQALPVVADFFYGP